MSSLPPALPRGVADIFGGAAVAKRQAEAALRELARRWAYVEVIPPTFEYAETLAAEAGTQLAEELYRFLDRDGHALALRPDLTIPTARLAGSKLADEPLPLRFFYAGPAFRYEEPRAGRQREFWQAGVEMIGAQGADADAEVLAFAATSLQLLGLPVIQFTLGHLGYFHGLLQQLALAPAEVQTLHDLLDRKSRDGLEAFASMQGLCGDDQAAVTGLLDLSGQPADEVLDRAARLTRNEVMGQAVAHLAAVVARLQHYGVAPYFAIDLADVRGMDYYTGITFKAYTTAIGFSVVNGGRYDNLVGHFGAARPAVGCAFYLDRILLARARQSGPTPEPVSDLLIHPCSCGTYVALARQARAAGLVVALALDPDQARAALVRVRCTCDDRVFIEKDGGSEAHTLDTWLSYVDRRPA